MELKFDEATIEGIWKQIYKKRQLTDDLNKIAGRKYIVMAWEEGSPAYNVRVEASENIVSYICLGYREEIKKINQWLQNNGVVLDEK